MDVQNISNLESPLYNTLVTRSQRDPWTYSLLSNIGSFSKSRVEVPPQTDPGSFRDGDQEVHWKIPRYGLLAKVCILNRIKIKDVDGSQTEHADFNDAFGFYLWKELRLETHNKRIQALYPEYQYMRMQSLPYERRQSMQGAVVQDGSALASEGNSEVERQFYTPAFFAFSERTNNFIDTRFVENLEVVGIARKGSEISTLNAGDGDSMSFSSGYPKLICYFYNPTEEIYRAYQHRNFTLERPLTMLQYDVFRETPEIKKADASDSSLTSLNGKAMVKPLTIKKKLDCNNLVFATHVMVRQRQSGIAGGSSGIAMKATCTVTEVSGNTNSGGVINFRDGNPGFVDGDFIKFKQDGTLDASNKYQYAKWVTGGTDNNPDPDNAADLGISDLTFYLKNVTSTSCQMIKSENFEHQPSQNEGILNDLQVVLSKVENDSEITAKITFTMTSAKQDAYGIVAKTVSAGSLGHRDHKDFLQIENVKVSGTSRELVNQPGFELLHLDNSAYGRFADSAGVKQFAGLTDASSESIYSLYWGLDNSRVACSGALSLKNLAAPEIEVTVDLGADAAGTTDEYELLVFHEYWQLVSIQGSDGRVSVGISV